METIMLEQGGYLCILGLLNNYHTADTNDARAKTGVVEIARWCAQYRRDTV